MRYAKLLIIPALVAALFIGSIPFSPKAHASFDANNLLSDGAFDATYTMTANQIDNFISGFSGSCISRGAGFTAPDPTGYSPSSGFSYGGNVTAGQVVYDASLAYGINPEVILTTLQKEEGLVRGDGPYGCSALAVSASAGYQCTDSGTASHSYNYTNGRDPGTLPTPLFYSNGNPVNSVTNTCVSSPLDTGFSEQVVHAAWLLSFGRQRSEGNTSWDAQHINFPEAGDSWNNSDDPATCYGGPMTQGTFKRCSADASAVAYDGWITIDGLSTHMDTGATAALYWYTPHFSGNQSFVNLFTSWFGSTQAPATCVGTESQLPYVVRYYNPRTFEHFYTAYACDEGFLEHIGYIMEGPVFNTTLPSNGLATPVYRYYDPATGQHMWDTNLVYGIQPSGYQLDNSGVPVFYVDSPNDPSGKAVYRFYNPNTYLHLWASSVGLTVTDLGIVSQAGYYLEGPTFYTQ